MVELLTIEKRRLLDVNGGVTTSDFRAAWERCWEIIVLERGWAHATRLRRSMRQAQDETKDECRAAFLDLPTPFATAAASLTEAAGGMCLQLVPEQVGKAILAAFAYVEVEDTADAQRASRASNHASDFMAMSGGHNTNGAL